MRDLLILNSFTKPVLNFFNYYRDCKFRHESKAVRYRMITTLDEFKKTNLIQLSFLDNPGDIICPLGIQAIKKSPDIIAGMHPMDINTINDLYYLSKDKIAELQINGSSITAFRIDGQSITFNINEVFDPDTVSSTRLSYMIGYMQAEKLMTESLSFKDKYCIVKDNITTLEILDTYTNNKFLKNPLDILFSEEYKNFSKKDIGHIGYICGQMSRI